MLQDGAWRKNMLRTTKGTSAVGKRHPVEPFHDILLAMLQGWSPERSMKLGGDMLTAVHEVLPILRD